MKHLARTKAWLGLAVFLMSASAFADSAWVVKKEAWTSSDEKNYSAFVAALGASGCNTVNSCLHNAANPYRNSDAAGAYFDADCAKFPYLLRAYFAWKNGLPFSYANDVVSVDGQGNDLRYSPNGNMVTSRRSIVPASPGQEVGGMAAIRRMQDEVDSAMFRIHPIRDGVESGKYSDFYSVKIDRASVRPGTMVYDPAGHVVVVYKVEDDGRVRYFDAHPDKTVSHGVFGEKFVRSRPGSGSGFKNFRSLSLVGATRAGNGELIGGNITTLALTKTSGYSVEQFFGTEATPPYRDDAWKTARFKAGGQFMNFYDFVRVRLAVGELKFHPVEEMTNAMDALCGDIQDRVTAVSTALASGIQNQDHPARLPDNIYGTSGDWEQYSSPSRDARLKTSFREIRTRVQQMVEMYRAGDSRIDYHGNDLKGDLKSAYEAHARACNVSYKKTNGGTVSLSYGDVVERLWAMSFDPYNCAELRWGATNASELASCPDSHDKEAWYHAEQRLRNQVDRTYDVKMGFSLQDLINKVPNSGVDKAPDVDLLGYLNSL